jgi:predicted ribosome quality control (RQC) complex YloA/Tae2 family protein
MKKVSPINRALRPVESSPARVARGGRGVSEDRRMVSDQRGGGELRARVGSNREQNVPAPDSPQGREQLRGLFDDYHSREQDRQFQYIEQRVNDAVAELNARITTQEQQIQTLQNTLDSERRLSQSAVANLKDLFDGNYKVMTDISERYEDSHQAFVEDKATFDRRLEFIQQESLESTNQLRTAIIKSQDEDRVQLAESLRALADSIDRRDR